MASKRDATVEAIVEKFRKKQSVIIPCWGVYVWVLLELPLERNIELYLKQYA